VRTYLLTLLVSLAFTTACSVTPLPDAESLDLPEIQQADADSVGVLDNVSTEFISPDLDEIDQFDLRFDFEADTPDTGGQQCQPGEGCFLDQCDANADCQSGWCVQHLGESVCSVQCSEECPPGWACKQVAGTDPDVVYICISNYANLCRPCSMNGDCINISGAQDACLDYGPDGNFCGGQCEEEGDCPWGFSCSEIASVDGATLKQCINDGGECPCTDTSVALSLSTDCSVNNEFGTCYGKRTCSDEGLSACDANVPALEQCNGTDDDCDGESDEPDLVEGEYQPLCDDGNDCTEDKCSGAEGCTNTNLETGSCDDNNPCTVADHCEAGACIGNMVECDDQNPCTIDSCTETGGCTFEPNSGPCDDDNPCTVADQCADGNCAGTPVSCDCQQDTDCTALEDDNLCNGTLVCDLAALPYQCKVNPETIVTCPEPTGNAAICQAASCNPETGDCSIVPDQDGYLCDDNDKCTVNGTCLDGACTTGDPVNCNDGNPCTDDSCDASSGCVHMPNTAPCSDNDACTTGDVCNDSACVPGAGLVCDDGNACDGTETCNPAVGCVPGLLLVCDDDDACNGLETCNPDSGCIQGIPLVCDDGNSCTTDSCEVAIGCQQVPNQNLCDDGNACTSPDQCAAGLCVPGADIDCEDNNLCTDDTCNPDSGCVHQLNQAPCDDNDACTLNDHCQLGECASGEALVCDDDNTCTEDSCDTDLGCLHSNNDKKCDDGNACTLVDTCVEGKCASGQLTYCNDDNICTNDICDPVNGCIHLLNEAPCNDDDLCTTGDHCHLGECLASGQLACNDNNPCTADSCNPANGCQFLPQDSACDDGSKCTTGDHCAAGICVVTGIQDCNDLNPCTDDSCSPALGCVNAPNLLPCEDGDVCTVGDQCAGSLCIPGIDMECDDNNLCTDDTCDLVAGCLNAPNSLDCNDNDLCTPFDKCTGGTCVGTGAVDCNDSNVCTDDSCEADLGCVNAANALACDDNDACTTVDTCANKACSGGPELVCDDANSCTTDTCDLKSGCIYTPLPDDTDCEGGKTCQNGECVSLCAPGSQTFNYTGAQQTFVVPGGCENIQVEAWGAQGGCGAGGKGGRAKGTVPITSGETLYVYVGGAGGCSKNAKPGGFNGGGATVIPYGASWTNGDGGGGSDVRRGGSGLSNRVIVAGGGGGVGWGGTGGNGGGNTGQAGNPSGGGCSNDCAGKGGSQSGGGAGGYCSGDCVGLNGTLGQGGTGDACAACGGGGGGGYYGGGGGAHCAAGGGSSYFAPGVASSTNQQGVQSGSGKIVISWP
jgi:hypothetical protein